jgi:hypothetical protein
MTSEEYQAYLASREWRLLCEAVDKRSGGICERCHKHSGRAHHHLTYARIGHERLEDLQHICDPCHEYQSGKRHDDPAAVRVYMAGPVVERDNSIICWREVAFYHYTDGELKEGKSSHGAGRQLIYADPDIESSGGHREPAGEHAVAQAHGWAAGELVDRCMRQVSECDAVFAWIDRENTVGTIVEITAAALSKVPVPVYIAFSTPELAKHFYFVAALAACVTNGLSLEAAWKDFVAWVKRGRSIGGELIWLVRRRRQPAGGR